MQLTVYPHRINSYGPVDLGPDVGCDVLLAVGDPLFKDGAGLRQTLVVPVPAGRGQDVAAQESVSVGPDIGPAEAVVGLLQQGQHVLETFFVSTSTAGNNC